MHTPHVCTCAALWSSLALAAVAQSATPANPAASAAKEEIIQLSPFVVSAESETGWVATQSLAGSRLNTDLKDIAAPIEVLTKDFMDEFALNSIAEATIYTTNVEGFGDNLETGPGLGTGTGYPPPSRIRGLGNATLSRDFFGIRVSSDNYNIDRVTIASGPNNLLFGTGSPSGVIDTSMKRAHLSRAHAKIELQFDSNDSQRYTLDLNQPLLKDKLALRYAYLHEEKEYAWKPSGTDNDRHYGTIKWQPFRRTTISIHHEDARVANIRPQLLLPWDNFTPWYNAASIPGYVHTANQPAYANPAAGAPFVASSITNTVFQRGSNNPTVFIGNAGALAGRTYNINNTVAIKPPRLLPGVSRINDEPDGYTLSDGTYIPTDVNVSGLSRIENVHSRISNIFINQQIGENIFVELAAQRESYDGWIGGFGGYIGGTTIHVDPNQFAPDGVTPNPNFGKLYVNGDVFRQNDQVDTRDWRASVSYEKDFNRGVVGSRWRRILGKQRLAGLVSQNDFQFKQGEYFGRILPKGGLGGVDPVFTGVTLRQPFNASGAPQNGWANDGTRVLTVRYYLDPAAGDYSPNLGAANLNGPHTFLDSNGNPFTIDMLNTGLTDSFGRRLGTGRTLSLLKTRLETQQIAYQGFFWDGRLTALYGWRRDKANSASVADNGNVPDTFTGLRPHLDDITFLPFSSANSQVGITRTKGFIARPLRGLVKLPFDADLSLTFNQSSTFQPNVSNLSPFGEQYPGAKGKGEDIGFRLDLLDGKFSLRYTQFENEAGPARAGNVPFNRFRFTLSGVLNRVMALNDPSGSVRTPLTPYTNNLGFNRAGDGDPYWVVSNIHSEGKEISLDWQVTKNLQVRFNMNTQDVIESDIGLDWWHWLELELPKYQALTFPEGGRSNPRDLNGNGLIDTWTWDTAWRSDTDSTPIAVAYQNEAVNSSTGQSIIQSLDGRVNEFARDNRFNVNWVYRFDQGALKGFSVGGAFRYRAAPVLSYQKKSTPGGDLHDLDNPFKGLEEKIWDLSLNYRGRAKLWGKRDYRVGLNVRNLLSTDELYAKMVNADGVAIRTGRINEPRTFILSLAIDL